MNPSPTIPAGDVGQWVRDGQGLPAFELLSTGEDNLAAEPQIPLFLLGNHGITVFVDALGRYQLHTGERSWACLNGSRAGDEWLCESRLEVGDGPGVDLHAHDFEKRTFGCGFATFGYRVQNLSVERTLSLAPSTECGLRRPVLFVTLRIANSSAEVQTVTWTESVGARYDFSFQHNFPFHKSRVSYPVSVETSDRILRARFSPKADMPLVLAEGNDPAWQESFPPSVYFGGLDRDSTLSFSTPEKPIAWLRSAVRREVPPGESITLQCVVGYGQEDLHWPALLKDHPRPGEDHFRALWRQVVPAWTDDSRPELALEMQWHAATLHAMATWSAWYQEVFIPQGTVYDYALGCSAVVRDHLQHALPLCHYDAPTAGGILRFIGKHTDPWGHIRMSDEGANQYPMPHDRKSDSQIYALFVLSEYLLGQRDAGLLVEPIHFLASPRATDLLDCAGRWLRFLRDGVKTGPHGLVRLGCSDWSDTFYEHFANIAYQRIFGRAESGLNSAMAVVTLGRLADALEAVSDADDLRGRCDDVQAVIGAARAYRTELLDPVIKMMHGRDFMPRAYVGDLSIGEDELFFEPQPWLLMIPELADRHEAIWNAIRQRVWDEEPRGARQREKPGRREDGGIWYALNGPLVAALSERDLDAAWEALEKLTCRRHAETYPGRWIGMWSNGDSIHSHHLGNPSEAGRVASYLYPMPVCCAHAHAWPLHGWLTCRRESRTEDGR